jgi:UDP-N-acetyl-D-mannosaminuronate dehydrogenase
VTSENTVQSLDECIDGVKAIVIVTEHSDVIEKLSNIELGDTGIEVVVDGRNCLDGNAIRNQNVLYRGIGR